MLGKRDRSTLKHLTRRKEVLPEEKKKKKVYCQFIYMRGKFVHRFTTRNKKKTYTYGSEFGVVYLRGISYVVLPKDDDITMQKRVATQDANYELEMSKWTMYITLIIC